MLGVSVVMLGGSAAPVAAGQAPQPVVELQVGRVKTTPGGRAIVPLMILLQPAVNLTRTTTTICFDGSLVRFVVVEAAPAGEASGARIQERTESRDGRTCVALDVAFPKPVETGTLAELTFEVDAGAPVNQEVELRAEGSAEAAEGAVDVSVKSGAINIAETANIFGCFFYMH
jgi:hypothetical protein